MDIRLSRFQWKMEDIKVKDTKGLEVRLGVIPKPEAEVIIMPVGGEGKEIGVPVVIDSGAVISVFSRKIGEDVFPNKVTSGISVDFESASGGKIKTYIHIVNLKLDPLPFFLPIRVAFREDAFIERNLLGRCDVFSFLSIYFDRKNRRTCFW